MSNDIRIEPRQLDIYGDGQRLVWRETDDMQIALTRGAQETGVNLPDRGEGGYVLVALQMDHDDLTTIATSDESDRTPIEVVDDAIAALTLLRNALAKIS